ncbi:hypothetical protein AAVH_35511 [Aphelenchoides avenae]|nr:hypothetical protein AAVH_35511 [Aphelenchus avenae]
MDPETQANGSFPLDEWAGATAPGDSSVHGKYMRLERLDPAAHGDDLWMALCGPDADPNQFRYVKHGPYKTRESFDGLLQRKMGRQYCTYAIVNKANGKAEGYNSYQRIHTEDGTIEVGEHTGACMQRTVRSRQ